MARRTIRARRASPYQLYLLIAFSLLFVVCAVGWAWTYNLGSGRNQYTFGLRRLEQPEANVEQLWKELQGRYAKRGDNLADVLAAAEEQGDQYQAEIHRLTERLVGDPFTEQETDQLRQSVSDVLTTTNGLLVQSAESLKRSYQVVGDSGPELRMTSMQAALIALIQRLEAMLLHIKQNNTAIGQLQAQNQAIQEELGVAKEEHNRIVAQLKQDLEDEKTRIVAARESAIAQSKKIKDEMQDVMDKLIAFRRQSRTELEKAGRENLVMKSELQDLQEVIEDFRTVPNEAGADGRVVRVGGLGNVAYGDLGTADGILLGMTFSIFDADELAKPLPEPKGQARVVRVMADACELQIFQTRAQDPVVIGDLLHNPIYDRQRRLRFMLVGKIDIDGDTYDDSDQLKAMITQFGGQLDSDVTIHTDYLIAGEKPAVLPTPGPDAGPMERQAAETSRKAFIAYADASAKAESFSIPILSLNRFLGLVGVGGTP